MALWATKRKFIYGGGFLIAVFLIFGGIFWQVFYNAPTCSDGYKNGGEKGVDCGGNCTRLCSTDTLEPIILWSKIFNISGDLYNTVAYVENPNLTSENPRANYEFKIYDSDNTIIAVKMGFTSIPKGKKFAVFETGIVINNATPKSTDFKFVSFSPWEKDTMKEPDLSLEYSSLLSTSSSPRITGVITNNSLENIKSIELGVFVLDAKENVIATSRSFIDDLLKRTSQDFVFTWPKPFSLGDEICPNPLDIVLALDKSGSMKSEGQNPPEPFTTVLKTAQSFVRNLSQYDQVGIVSFGTEAKEESLLSFNKEVALTAIENISFNTAISEETNLAGGLATSLDELFSIQNREESKKIIILLTDGVPTLPKVPDEPNYPTSFAESLSSEIKDSGILVYTIGLGKSVNEGFLKSISTSDSYYFFSPTRETLESIYSKIGSSLCPKKPNVITVIYRLL